MISLSTLLDSGRVLVVIPVKVSVLVMTIPGLGEQSSMNELATLRSSRLSEYMKFVDPIVLLLLSRVASLAKLVRVTISQNFYWKKLSLEREE